MRTPGTRTGHVLRSSPTLVGVRETGSGGVRGHDHAGLAGPPRLGVMCDPRLSVRPAELRVVFSTRPSVGSCGPSEPARVADLTGAAACTDKDPVLLPDRSLRPVGPRGIGVLPQPRQPMEGARSP